MYCQNCGVELEDNMTICPLCEEPVTNNHSGEAPNKKFISQKDYFSQAKMSLPQKKITWEIVSIVLLSGTIASFIVDFFINHNMSWSEYTVAIGLTIFSYVSLFAFWDQRTIIKIIGGFIVSSVFLVFLDALTNGINWSIRLAIPLLLAANLIVIILISVIQRSKFKGINLIAYAFIAAALLCLSIDTILSFFETRLVKLRWSIIVSACVIPVVMVLFFLHYRFKKGRSLKKTFHI
jgi:hypothetical protein